MSLRIVEIHPAESEGALNTEWFVIQNDGETPFNTKNCTLSVSRRAAKKPAPKAKGAGARRGKGGAGARRELGTLDPGFTMAPGEKVRIISGNPGRKAHGVAPDDGTRNYNLFLGGPVIQGAGTVLHFALRSHPLASAVFDPEAKSGVGSDD